MPQKERSNSQQQAGADSGSGAGRPPEKKRRWLKVIIVLLVLLVLLVALAPTLISTNWGRDIVASVANDQIRGHVRIRDLSLGWFGACEVTGLEVDDPQGRRILETERIEWDRGLWKALWSGRELGRIKVNASQVDLYLDREWKPSLLEAFELRKPRPPKPIKPFSIDVVLENARLNAIRHDGRRYAVSGLTVDVRVAEMKDIYAELSGALENGGKLECKADLKGLDLTADNVIEDASGDVSIGTDSSIDIAPLVAFATDDVVGTGALAMDISADVRPDRTDAEYTIRLDDFTAGEKGDKDSPLKPTDLQVAGEIKYRDRTLAGTLNVTKSAIGTLNSKLENVALDNVPDITWSEIAGGIAEGKIVSLPQFVVTADGSIDLAAASRTVPALMNLRKDVRIVAGGLKISSLRVEGGKQPSAAGALKLDLTTQHGREQKKWRPVEAEFKITSDSDRRLNIENVNFRSSFATVNASGALAEMDAKFDADLDAMHAELKDILEMGDVVLGGNVSGTLTAARPKDTPKDNIEQTNLALDVCGDNVRYGASPDTKTSAGDGDKGPSAFTGDVQWNVAVIKNKQDKSTTLDGSLKVRKLNISSLGDIYEDGGPMIKHTVVFYDEPEMTDLHVWNESGSPIEVAPLAALVSQDVAYTGSAVADVRAEVRGDKTDGHYTVRLVDFSARDKGQDESPVEPVDAQITGEVHYRPAEINGTLNVSKSALGTLKTQIKYVKPEQPFNTAWMDIVDAVAAGKIVELPQFALTADGRIDLAAASRSVPALMNLRKDVRIVEGGVKISSLRVEGGKQPSAAGALELDLTTLRGQKRKSWRPITTAFNITSDSKRQVNVKNFNFKSSFASVDAAGTMAAMDAKFDADLDAMHAELKDVLDMEDVVLGGNLNGTLKATNPTDRPERTNLVLDLQAKKVKYGEVSGKKASAKDGHKGPAAYTGDINWTATTERKTDNSTTLDGRMTLKNLVISEMEDVFKDYSPTIQHNLVFQHQPQRIDVSKFTVNSKLLSLELAGSIVAPAAECLLNLRGEYSGSWKEWSALARQLSPEAAKDMAMLGISQGEISITGPASQPDIRPKFRKLQGSTAMAWGKGSSIYGLTLGRARLSPALAKAVINLPVETIDANEGKLRLGGMVDLSGEEPTLLIPGRLDILEDVSINEEMGRVILSRILPLLAKTNKLQGLVSLQLEDIRLPLSEKIKTAGSGKGRMDLSKVKILPAGTMTRLMQLMGLPTDKPYPLTISRFNFEIRDGGIWYDDLTLMFADRFDVKFYGVVKFDDTVDLAVSVPIKTKLLTALGVTGPIAQYVRLLEGSRIEIPLVGDRLNPKLNLSKVDVKPLINNAIRNMTEGGFLEQFLRPKSED